MRKLLLSFFFFFGLFSCDLSFATSDYASMSPSDHGSYITISGNDVINNNYTWNSARADLSKSSGKWYWEVTIIEDNTSNEWVMLGIWTSSAYLWNYIWYNSDSYSFQNNSNIVHNNIFTTYWSNVSAWDVIGVALDLDNWTLKFYLNGTDLWIAFTSLSWDFFPMVGLYRSTVTVNFWSSSFAYSVPLWYNPGFYEDITPSCTLTPPACSPDRCDLVTGTPSLPNQNWVKNSESCGFTCLSGWEGSFCMDRTPVPITGYFSSPVSVASGSYNWNMTLNLSMSGYIDDIASIELWDAFKVDNATPSGNTIILSLSPFSGSLQVACTTYTVTVPSSLVQWNDGVSINLWDIVWSFTVTGCPGYVPTWSWTTYYTASGVTFSNTGASYLWFLEKHDDVYYFNVWSVIYIVVLLSVIVAIFYGLFRFYLNFMLSKKWRN